MWCCARAFRQGDALVAELCAAVRPLGGYKVPERFAFIDELPRTTLLKIDRRALRGRRAKLRRFLERGGGIGLCNQAGPNQARMP